MAPSSDTGRSQLSAPDWRRLTLAKGILREDSPDLSRVVLWVPGRREGGFQYWERISNVARASISAERGVGATSAKGTAARQRIGVFHRLLRPFRGSSALQQWVLPRGGFAESIGERRDGLLLAWALDQSKPLDGAAIQTRWPGNPQYRQLGPNFFLVWGIEAPLAANDRAQAEDRPQELAEQFLAAARQRGDRHAEATALVDLGVAAMRQRDPALAAQRFDQARALARELGDRARESDALGNLGLAAMALREPRQALGIFEQELQCARAAGDRFAEKLGLYHLGMFQAGMQNHASALELLESALAIARQVGDREDEAELLTRLATSHGALGQRDQAVARAESAVDLLRRLGKPEAATMAEELEQFRRRAPRPEAPASPAVASGSIVVAGWGNLPTPGAEPGFLRMAMSAAKSAAKFVGAGMKTVSPEVHRARLRACATCEHHTGLRCKLCGCFTNAKAWLPDEGCPVQKWPV
jgi:tetratricopeptide (TPR) repeat protein